MTDTEIASEIGQPNLGYAVVAMLTEQARRQAQSILSRLHQDITEGIWVMPTDALHITLCEIIQPKPYSRDKQTLFDDYMGQYADVLQKQIEQRHQIHVHFQAIEASQQAIILRGDDGGICNAIRSEMVRSAPLPLETKLPPNIVHTSVARYTERLNAQTVTNIVSQYQIDIHEVVSEFLLIKNISPPLLHYETLQTYLLKT